MQPHYTRLNQTVRTMSVVKIKDVVEFDCLNELTISIAVTMK